MTDRYAARPDGRFVVRDYNRAKPFSSFLAGIAGVRGVPVWAYYVNRGQAIATFGLQDKDHAFLEFESVKLHQHRTATEGFRTFVRCRRDNAANFYEPFRLDNAGYDIANQMTVLPHGLELEEHNRTLNLRTTVRYTTLCDHPFGALVRRVWLENTDERPAEIELLDGVPRIIPFGQDHLQTKVLPFVNEGYLEVAGIEGSLPFIKLRAQSTDNWEVNLVRGGNFFGGRARDGEAALLPAIIDVERVFGDYADWIRPYVFMAEQPYAPAAPQGRDCQTCCGFLYHRFDLPPGAAEGIDSLWGAAEDEGRLEQVASAALASATFDEAWAASEREIEAIRGRFFLHTADAALNAYLPNTYLDNVLRGGLPISFTADDTTTVFHVFSRKHGDLERDYNFFSLSPTRYSQGNGNFRDVNQNRRHDVWFNPEVQTTNVKAFFNLVQLDGYNPLLIEGTSFRIADDEAARAVLARHLPEARQREALLAHCREPFTPGTLVALGEVEGIGIDETAGLLGELLAVSDRVEDASFMQGYWVDHWVYCLDHIDAYLAIYPERWRELLLEDDSFTYFDPTARVLERTEKHVLCHDGQVRQLDCVAPDPEKLALLSERTVDVNKVRTDAGRGAVYRTNLLQKLLCLLANKMTTLAPSGLGIDMEAGHPGWLDSINGLPGVFGSSTSELYHMLRTLRFIRESFAALAVAETFEQPIPVELAELLDENTEALRDFEPGGDMAYWERCSSAREAYRRRVRFGITGEERPLSVAAISAYLDLAEAHLDRCLGRTRDARTGLPATYYRHKATAWEAVGPAPDGRGTAVRVTAFEAHQLPVFLEAPIHAMRLSDGSASAQALYEAMRAGPLYDRKLGMYMTGENVRDEGPELGRLWSWSPGWFENENIFLHAEHKYLLSCLRSGLHRGFFEDMRRCFMAYQDPERLGRNPLENASFIMSSRQPKPGYHGRAYQPRSSGMTAEVIEMMLFCLFGPRPFGLEDGELTLSIRPTLPGWWFTEAPGTRAVWDVDGRRTTIDLPAGCVAARFLGRTLVILENPAWTDTFGERPMSVGQYIMTDSAGAERRFEGPRLRGEPAHAVRRGEAATLRCRLTSGA